MIQGLHRREGKQRAMVMQYVPDVQRELHNGSK